MELPKTAGNLLFVKQKEATVVCLLAVGAAYDPTDCCETCFVFHTSVSV